MTKSTSLIVHPLTPERWDDLEALFGRRGACSGCWCMWWRTSRARFESNGNAGNRRAFRKIVRSGEVPGVLGYVGGEVVAWCSVAPRETYASLCRSRVLRPVDDAPVWSIACFYVARAHRGERMSLRMIRAAVDYVRERGGRVVEAYPTDPRGRRLQGVSSFMGVPSLFERCGFEVVARPSAAKVIMRRRVRPRRRRARA